ncbi:unnamed protein product, partial [marine sediment metagenome]
MSKVGHHKAQVGPTRREDDARQDQEFQQVDHFLRSARLGKIDIQHIRRFDFSRLSAQSKGHLADQLA